MKNSVMMHTKNKTKIIIFFLLPTSRARAILSFAIRTDATVQLIPGDFTKRITPLPRTHLQSSSDHDNPIPV